MSSPGTGGDGAFVRITPSFRPQQSERLPPCQFNCPTSGLHGLRHGHGNVITGNGSACCQVYCTLQIFNYASAQTLNSIGNIDRTKHLINRSSHYFFSK